MSLKEIVKDSVAILIPCGGMVEPRVFQSAIVLTSYANENGYKIRQVGVTESTLIHTARNVLARGFLETDCEWSFWMDSDMILEARTIPALLSWAKKLNVKLVTGVYYQRYGEHVPVILIRDEKNRSYEDVYSHTPILPPEGQKAPFKINRAGFGCMMVHRDVLVALDEPYFKYSFISDKKEFSEDFYFCMQAEQAGFELWAIPELTCGHVGQAPVITRADCKPSKHTMPLDCVVAG